MSRPSDPNQPAAKSQNLVDLDSFLVRMQVLQLAHNPADTQQAVVARAKAYLKWLIKPENGDTQPTPVNPT